MKCPCWTFLRCRGSGALFRLRWKPAKNLDFSDEIEKGSLTAVKWAEGKHIRRKV